MSNDRSAPINVPEPESRPRRASIADLFSKQPSASNSSGRQPSQQQANQRRLSITTLGLSGSPTQTSAFGNQSFRRGSMSSSLGSAPTEDAVADDPESSSPGATPSSPWARRVSFGAQALREARAGSISNGRYPPRSGSGPSAGVPSSLAGVRRSPPLGSASTTTTPAQAQAQPRSSASTSSPLEEKSNPSRRVGEGFNWSEALRSRAERAPSIGGPISPQNPSANRSHNHQRAASIASMEQPIREIPKQPKQNKPDFFQEKILRGDFMD
ncbi:hypothetical protein N7509_002118 [Penicillium cosmopolitanum]|uniref:Uncharacterized protein n=1 Tax=Penicillium cosmopolitanum TaxID=1131564 RepID=A0A9W9W8T5_9EURO|nr:uncharacterized protein N7509_002118 [Penicillium cosmopolitanum]KAJ5408235.1 hypothetical protein N7509_002118 [Penicillium cosmopolitanum]